MKKTLKKELFYLIKSKIIWLILGIASAVIILGAVQVTLNVKSADSVFQMDKAADTNFNQDIKKDFSISTSGGQTTINNAVKYDYEGLEQANQTLGFVGFPQFIFKDYGMTFFSLLSGLIGILTISYDYRFSTYKRRLGWQSWREILLGKLITITVTTLVTYLFVYVLSTLVSAILRVLVKIPDAGKYGFSQFLLVGSDSFYLTLFSFLIGLALALVCATLVLASKHPTIVGVIFILYLVIVPSAGKLDWKNMTLNLFAPFGNNLGIPPLSMIKISPSLIVVLFIGYLLAILLGSVLVFYKRTRYTL